MLYYAAPMEGLTDRVWRQAHQRWFGGADRYYAPFLSPPENRVPVKKKMAELERAANPGAPVVPQLLGRDGGYGVEDPGYAKPHRILTSCGAVVRPIPLDGQGLRVDVVRERAVRVVHVTPSHHYPLGIIMPVARRQALLRWAAEQPGRYILEDDYDSEFRFSGRPIPALQSLDGGERVIYLNTFAKSLAPSLRIGYMVLPPHLAERYRREFLLYSSTVPSFEQYTLSRFL